MLAVAMGKRKLERQPGPGQADGTSPNRSRTDVSTRLGWFALVRRNGKFGTNRTSRDQMERGGTL